MVDAIQILSKTAFAAKRGVGVSTVSKWIERKRISGAALTEDGRINVVEAERQLGVNLDVMRSEGARAVRVAAVPEGSAELSIREQILSVDLEQKRRRLEAENGVYVRADQVRAERGRALSQMMAAIENWIPDVAAELALGAEALATMKASWRQFREHQADALVAEAKELPELLSDAAA